MKLYSSFILFLLLCVTYHVAGQNNTFTFKGKVHSYGKPLKGALIEVYDVGDLIQESYSKGNGNFEFELEPEKQYMVDISMENLRTKTIWINTTKTKDLDFKIPTFAFDVYLKKEKTGRYDELSEIPVTLIKYQAKKREFYMDKSYEEAVESKKKKIEENTIEIR